MLSSLRFFHFRNIYYVSLVNKWIFTSISCSVFMAVDFCLSHKLFWKFKFISTVCRLSLSVRFNSLYIIDNGSTANRMNRNDIACNIGVLKYVKLLIFLSLILKYTNHQIYSNIYITDNEVYEPSIERDAGLGSILFHLIEGPGSERVGAHETL